MRGKFENWTTEYWEATQAHKINKLRARMLNNNLILKIFRNFDWKDYNLPEILICFESFEENAQISEENKVQNDGGEVSRKHIGAYC